MAAQPLAIGWRWAEFAALFIAAPLAMAVLLPPRLMFVALFGFTLVGLALLWRTGGFDWRDLIRGWSGLNWPLFAGFAVLVGVTGWAIMAITHPGHQINLSPARLRFLALIWVLYPILSALPQELIFRALFFHRYAALFGRRGTAVLANAGAFALAHLLYWSIIVTVLTFAGGWLFARLYLRRGFGAAWLAHALAGNMLFAVGMGVYFWSGNAVRPF